MILFTGTKNVQARPPLFIFFEILGDMLGKQNVPGIPAIHHPLRYVETGTGEIGVTVYIYHAADRTDVHPHPKFQTWLIFKDATNLHCALRLGYNARGTDHRQYM